MDDIRLTELNYVECARYLGYGDSTPEENIMEIMRECEADILAYAVPRFVYKLFDVEQLEQGVQLCHTDICFSGQSVKEHLEGCHKAVLLCVTLSDGVDRLIRKTEIQDMAKAVVLDAMATTAIEAACGQVEEVIKNAYVKHFGEGYFTWRYGFGYGDLPLEEERMALQLLNAEKVIGVTLSDSLLMMPRKTTACIMGISKTPITTKKKGCISCNLREKCKFRKRGNHCGF